MKVKLHEKNLGYPLGYLFSLYATISMSLGFFFIWKYSYFGLIISILLTYSVYAIDYITSNATEYNMMILEKNGFNSKSIIKEGLLSNFIGFILTGPIYVYLFKGIEPHYDFKLVKNLFISLVLTEIYFSSIHRIMHRYLPDVHKIHHCCLRPSLMTNIFFGKLDGFIEANIPEIINLVYNGLIMKDYFSLLIGITIINVWYNLDHDEYLKLPHWYHHQYINSNYGVYIKGGSFDEKDSIKKVILR